MHFADGHSVRIRMGRQRDYDNREDAPHFIFVIFPQNGNLSLKMWLANVQKHFCIMQNVRPFIRRYLDQI